MRGVYAVEDEMRWRRAPFVVKGLMTRNCRFARRLTTAVHPGEEMYKETSDTIRQGPI
jgi:hypothetical protein